MSRLHSCRLIDLPRLVDDRGALTFIESPLLPFEVRRIYYLYDVPPFARRGAHGHARLEQLMIAVSGALDVELDDGTSKRVYRLSRPDQALYIGPMIWRDLSNFAPGTVCAVLASERYDESDYFRGYSDFLSASKGAM